MTKAGDNTESKRSKRGTGRLYKRDGSGKEFSATSKAKGDFWLQYQVNGKRVRVRLLDEVGKPITTIKKAEAERARILEPINAKDKAEQLRFVKSRLEFAEEQEAAAIDKANPPLSIAAAWAEYEGSNERPDSGADTLRRYGGYWNQFAGWLCKKKPPPEFLRDITPQMAREYANHLSQSKASPNTFNKHTGFLRLFFRVLEDAARMDGNPFGKIKRKKLKTEVRRELSLEELHTILDTASGELKTLLFIGTFTGLRLGDCSTLKWGEVDLLRGVIKRVPSKTKGNDGKPVTIGIPAPLHGILSQTPKSRRKGYVVPMFADLYTYENTDGKRIRQSMITEQIQAHFRKLGINTHKEGTGTQLKPDPEKPGEYVEEKTGKRAVVEVGFHSLRHTFVSLQAESGTPQAVVQAIVGHGNPAMTRHYTHIGEEAAKQAALAMPSNIVDADFEVLPDPLPPWAVELAEELNSKNWKQVKKALLERKPKQKGQE
ncbi:site-specific integrase [Pontiellaceae bacterium B1224]|nr:site-specific integrase [Pontiellaceae bacterium B1224]